MSRPALALMLSTCLALPCVATGARRAAGSQQPSVNPQAAATEAFRKRVDDYLNLRRAVAKQMPKVGETDDPAKISLREKALGEAIAAARASAKAGDVFGADMSPYLLRILTDDWNARSQADRKAIFDEVPPGLQLKVNQPYPATIPFVTVPGKLLAKLPALPEELEYRLIDRRLLLRDRDANLIVDIVAGAPAGRDR